MVKGEVFLGELGVGRLILGCGIGYLGRKEHKQENVEG